MSTVSSIQTMGSTETLLIKPELHFERFSLYPLGAFLNVVTNLSPSQSFHRTNYSYRPMYVNPDIRILEMFACGIWKPGSMFANKKSGILGFGTRNTTQGIHNPSSTDKEYPVPGIRKPWRGIQNPRVSWTLLHGAIAK